VSQDNFKKYAKKVERLNSQVQDIVRSKVEISEAQLETLDNLYDAFIAISNLIYDNFELSLEYTNYNDAVIKDISQELGVTDERVINALNNTEEACKLDQKVNHYIQKKYIKYLHKRFTDSLE
jgi:hypothetical protein